jgi:ERO1-like protein beta
MYFNTVLLLGAVERLRPYLMAYDYCSTGNHEDDEEAFQTLSKVLKVAHEVRHFDETVLFHGENAKVSLIIRLLWMGS